MTILNANEYITKGGVMQILQKAYTEGRIQAKDGCTSVLDDISAVKAADVQPISQWISVKDRLPEIIDNTSSEAVLIHLENGEQYVAILIGEDNENRIEAFWSTSDMHRDFECDVVTHWQPLPESPKYGGAENG